MKIQIAIKVDGKHFGSLTSYTTKEVLDKVSSLLTKLERGENAPLHETTKNFIKVKVKDLGSVKAVKQLYKEECPLDRWAITYAQKLFKVYFDNDPSADNDKKPLKRKEGKMP